MHKLIAPIVVVLAAASCGEVKTYNDAAPGPDGTAIDAEVPAPDAVPTGSVTVTATHRFTTPGPAAGVDVIVVGPDGTVGETVQTGADGTATVAVTAGDSITTIFIEGNQRFLTTHVAVEPGDQLRVGGNYQGVPTDRGTMTVTWAPYGGATSYYIHGPCSYYIQASTAPTTYSYPFQSNCGTSTFDVAVIAYGASGIIGWKLLTTQTFSGGGSLPLGALQNAGSFGVSLSGLPAEVTYASTSASGRLTGNGWILGGGTSGNPVGGALTGSFPWATAGAGTIVDNYFSRSGYHSQNSREPLPASATSYNRTSVEMLPWVDYSFTVNAAARAVTWIQDGDSPYDGAVVNLYYSRSGTPTFGGLGTSYFWSVVIPPGITNLTFPELPPAYAIHDLQDTDTPYGGVVLFERSDADGYRGFRGVPTWELECPNCGSAPFDAPAMRWSGQVSD